MPARPTFDSDGSHRATPAELQVAAEPTSYSIDSCWPRKPDEIARLEELYRLAFVLRDLEEMPTAEVAEVLGIEPAAVGSGSTARG